MTMEEGRAATVRVSAVHERRFIVNKIKMGDGDEAEKAWEWKVHHLTGPPRASGATSSIRHTRMVAKLRQRIICLARFLHGHRDLLCWCRLCSINLGRAFKNRRISCLLRERKERA
jgi:hypothetical protein